MDEDVIRNVWMEPGTDYRGVTQTGGKRTPRFGRSVLGEKGVGRFASHKLGRRIELVTRKARGQEIAVTIDWDSLEVNRSGFPGGDFD